jgi:hypothetical protein
VPPVRHERRPGAASSCTWTVDLNVTRQRVLDGPPTYPLTLADLGAQAAASQAPLTH